MIPTLVFPSFFIYYLSKTYTSFSLLCEFLSNACTSFSVITRVSLLIITYSEVYLRKWFKVNLVLVWAPSLSLRREEGCVDTGGDRWNAGRSQEGKERRRRGATTIFISKSGFLRYVLVVIALSEGLGIRRCIVGIIYIIVSCYSSFIYAF